MNRLKEKLIPQVVQTIVDNLPQTKRFTAKQFFKNDIANRSSEIVPEADLKHFSTLKKDRRTFKKLWEDLSPEVKRKYYVLSELQDIKIKTERSLRLSEIWRALDKNGITPEKLLECLPRISNQKEESFTQNLDKNYHRMIELGSVRKQIKNVLEDHSFYDDKRMAGDLILNIPEDYHRVLTKPRRPVNAFTLFCLEHKDRISFRMFQDQKEMSFFQTASLIWKNTSPSKRKIYEDRYEKSLAEYNERMAEFSSQTEPSIGEKLAEEEHYKYTKSIKKELRDSKISPIGIRSACNYFLRHTKLPFCKASFDLWYSLTDEEKEKYVYMSRKDEIKYRAEMKLRHHFIDTILEAEGSGREKRLGSSDTEDSDVQ